jgi:hypothetical protein
MKLQMISINDQLPADDQDVIAYNATSKRLVAAKYVKVRFRVSETPYVTEDRGMFQVEKYVGEGDRSLVNYWLIEDISHWMPAVLETI